MFRNFRNFRNLQKKRLAFGREVYTAEVDKVTKFLWFESITTVGVCATVYPKGSTGYWRYIDTGKYTEGYQMEELYFKYQIDNAEHIG